MSVKSTRSVLARVLLLLLLLLLVLIPVLVLVLVLVVKVHLFLESAMHFSSEPGEIRAKTLWTNKG